MHALAHACFCDPDNAFAALAFELQLHHFPAQLPIQRLYLFCGDLSTVGAILIFRFAEKGDLFFFAKNFIALIAHHRVRGEEETKGADEAVN